MSLNHYSIHWPINQPTSQRRRPAAACPLQKKCTVFSAVWRTFFSSLARCCTFWTKIGATYEGRLRTARHVLRSLRWERCNTAASYEGRLRICRPVATGNWYFCSEKSDLSTEDHRRNFAKFAFAPYSLHIFSCFCFEKSALSTEDQRRNIAQFAFALHSLHLFCTKMLFLLTMRGPGQQPSLTPV